ncbi:aldehyde dehydrogenase family protein [Halobacterium wangiae]|uniref:aldehyde dehydrogenase family protein n=1 Tax=Halobacterium wangiae TaxID=2902623 RepID=UPI001E469460|nr:aldehyde dehydrogenase family protein [Halobacterium wangiae]
MSSTRSLERHDLLIGGERVPPASDEYVETVDPATGEAFAEVAVADESDVDRAVRAASEAFPGWRDTDPVERGQTLHRVAELIRDNADELADLESRDQGKPLSQARSDILSAARYFEYYAGAADKLEGRSVPVGTGQVDYVVREPYGVSAQIIPWNFPGNLFARGVAPALAAGNTAVVKPAPTTPLSAYRLAELCAEAGVPEAAVNVVSGAGETGAALTDHAGVDTITFTGSVRTGQRVMEAAAGNVTPVTLELGGKNPAIVYPDADLEEAVSWVERGIFANAGQVCSAADRAIVHEDHYDEFVERIVERAEAYELGPGAEDPDMGPLNSAEHFERVRDYVEVGVEEGARLATGGEAPDRDGYFIEPTVLADVDNGMRVAQEEIFGPVLTVIPYGDDEDPVDIGNDVDYGLVAGVFTNDVRRAHRAAQRLQAGNVYVNKWFGDTNQTPFGGYKQSGIGREKGLEAMDSYLQSKNVAVNLEEGSGGDLPGA